MWETWVQSLGWKIPWRRERLPTPVFWPGEFHGLYSAWGCKESDRTERLSGSLFTLVRYNISRETLLISPTSVGDQFEIRKDKVKMIIIFVCSPNGVGREPEKNRVNQELSLQAEYS